MEPGRDRPARLRPAGKFAVRKLGFRFRTPAPIRGTEKTMARTRVLVVDDEQDVRDFCVDALEDAGIAAEAARAGPEVLAAVKQREIDLVLSDLRMPGMDGMELLRALRESASRTDLVIMTGYGSIAGAVEAMRLGAVDYLTKPLELDELISRISSLLDRRDSALRGAIGEVVEAEGALAGMVGRSPRMHSVFDLVLRFASRRDPVLVCGESGTGKELVARAIHQLSPWRDQPFVAVDCGALSPNLVESELFGHARGAFTGAAMERDGLLTAAKSGTVFLDEIGELPLPAQAKLLRTLQQREIRPVGSNRTIRLDARMVAATNRDLEESVKLGEFREDLFYRINVLAVRLPPLRERKSDIPLLASSFLEKYRDNSRSVTGFASDAVASLVNYDWPGNIRELENYVRRAVAMANGPIVSLADLPEVLQHPARHMAFERTLNPLQEAERKTILEALEGTGGNRLRAAERLGMGKTTIYKKLKEYGIDL